jgi:WD40 repeat protein
LEPIGQLHTKATSDFAFLDEHIVYGCGSGDTGVEFHDLRTGQLCQSIGSDRPLNSCSISSDRIQVAGGSNKVSETTLLKLWDLRHAHTCLHQADESFGDDITQVRYHPTLNHMLCTASMDGLICVFDTSLLPNEDDALYGVMNAEASVSKVGFFGPQNDSIYASTHMDTLSLWSVEGVSEIARFDHIRSQVSGLDYLIDCHYDTVSNQLLVFGGASSGVLCDMLIKSDDQIKVRNTYNSGHVDVVRAINYSQHGGVITGGEDGFLCRWPVKDTD